MNMKFVRFRNTATRLIKGDGAVFRMRRVSDPIEDPIEGTVTPGEIQVQDVTAVILPAGGSDAESFLARNSNLTLSDVKKVLIANEGLKWDPLPLEEFEYRGEWWIYDEAGTIDPDATTKILFRGFIRRA